MNKMGKKGIATIYIVLIVIGALAGVVILAKNFQSPIEDGFIKVRFYDANGNIISGNTYSIVNNIPGISYIDLTVTATNTGSLPLSCTIISGTPTPFDSAIAKTAKAVPITGTKQASWTSSLISVSQFEGVNPTVFGATIRCSYNSGGQEIFLPDQTGNISLIISPDGTGSFIVNVASGGAGSEYCGDGVCQSGESATSCPGDCVSIPNVKFRTNDLSYVSGGAIGHTSSCGSTLGRFGYNQATCWTVTDATCPTRTGYTLAISSGIPGKPYWGTSNGGCLYTDNANANRIAMAWKTTSSGACTMTGQWGVIIYDSTDADASKVSNSAQSFDTSKESAC